MFEMDDDRFTHMPFVGADGEFKPHEFCCIPVDGKWKIHHRADGEWERVPTGLPDDATECGPVAEFDEGMWKLSFIAGGYESDRRFKLYRMYGLDSAPGMIGFADVGFAWKNRIVSAGRRTAITIQDGEKTTTLSLEGVEYLYRISCDPQRPNRLLISGQYPGGEIFSWAYHPGLRNLYALLADEKPAYKCALWGNDCFYAKRLGGFEERRIVQASHWELRKIPADGYITETVTTAIAVDRLVELQMELN
jgi:hypothetical protein